MPAELPNSIVWSRTQFLEGSIGQDVFPDDLEGRERSPFLLTKSARFYVWGAKRWGPLDEAGVVTVNDLLRVNEVDLASWLKKPQEENLEITKDLLAAGLKAVVVGPEDHLMQAIFAATPTGILIPPSRESARKERILEVLQLLPERENKMIQLRFGISRFTPMTLEEVAKEMNVSLLKTRPIIERLLRNLSHSSRRKMLMEFLPGNQNI